jgi:hypothetical protein
VESASGRTGRLAEADLQDPLQTAWTRDIYPARCRGCGRASDLVLRWNPAGEVRIAWEGIERRRVDLVQPRASTARCGGCGSSDIAIGAAEIR